MNSAQPSQSAKSQPMERIVGLILFSGVTLSVLLLVSGLVWQWISTGHPTFTHKLPQAHFARFMFGEIAVAFREGLGPSRLINFGLITLMLTPYVRVVLSMIAFLVVERNLKYAVVTGFVSAVLTYSLFLQ